MNNKIKIMALIATVSVCGLEASKQNQKKTTNPSASSSQNVQSSQSSQRRNGMLFRCPFTEVTKETTKCEQTTEFNLGAVILVVQATQTMMGFKYNESNAPSLQNQQPQQNQLSQQSFWNQQPQQNQPNQQVVQIQQNQLPQQNQQLLQNQQPQQSQPVTLPTLQPNPFIAQRFIEQGLTPKCSDLFK